jgi:hypothetical protein
LIKLKSSEKITIHNSELKNIQCLLLKTNYELIEIWNSVENKEIQVWNNKKFKKVINITISEDSSIEDNTTKVVNELVDLWLELRAIRNAVEYNDEEYFHQVVKEPTAFEKYHSKFEEIEEEWNDNGSYMSKVFKENIDPSVLAYLHLDEDDKLLLTN